MGGKGRKRREKNYEAAHGGSTRLPPPPDNSSIDVLPSKLRQIMSLAKRITTTPLAGAAIQKEETPSGAKRKRSDQEEENIGFGGDEFNSNTKNDKKNKKKKKRKRNQAAEDLRFEKEISGVAGATQRKDRKKQRLEARKKKNKKGSSAEPDTEFRGHEKIKFGEVVEAPPKLTVPKAFKTTQGASQERLRLQAVEAYRNRKGWASRPGVQLPAPVTSTLD